MARRLLVLVFAAIALALLVLYALIAQNGTR